MEWMIQGLEKLGEIKPDALKKVLKDIAVQRPEIFRSLEWSLKGSFLRQESLSDPFQRMMLQLKSRC